MAEDAYLEMAGQKVWEFIIYMNAKIGGLKSSKIFTTCQ